jgi:multiple sugar transport system substrate-binding protein
MSAEKISRRKMLKGLGLAVAGTALAACQPQTVVVKEVVKETVEVEKEVEKVVTATPLPKEKVELGIYGFQGAALEPVFEAIAPRFMEKFPHIDVLSKSYAGAPGETEERMISRLAAGERPDSMWLHSLRTYEFVRLQVLERLDDEAVFPGGSVLFDAMFDQNIERMKLDMEGTYMMPNCIDIHQPAYNMDMVDAAGLDADNPPQTWDDFLVWLETLAEKGGPNTVPLDMLIYTPWAIMLYLASYPGMYTDSIVTIADTQSYKSLLDSEPVIDTIKLFKDIYDKGLVISEQAPPGTAFFWEQIVPIAFYPSNRGMLSWYETIADNFRWDVMGYPLPPGAKMAKPAVTGVGDGMGQVIFKIAEHKAEAWEWLKFSAEVEQEREFGKVYYTPPRKDMVDDPYVSEAIPQYQHAVQFAQNGIPRVGMAYTQIEKVIQDEYQKVLFENKSVEQAFGEASAAYDEILKAVQEQRAGG